MQQYDNFNKIFSILSELDPAPKTELDYKNDFTLLCAIVLSAQSTDVQVNKVTAELFKVVSTPKDILDLGLEKLKFYIKSLGLYNNKAQNLIKLAQVLLNKDIPRNLEELEQLPGVGGKTARVFLNCAYKVPIIAVDTHVFRVAKRLGLSNGANVKQVETQLNENVPDKWLLHAHHWLILHGRYVCKARKPQCSECKLAHICPSRNTGSEEEIRKS
jgi:endonuclease III